ncbi:MAG: hypothetical protein V1847_04245 [Candidatus Diapherotrites archaeon]
MGSELKNKANFRLFFAIAVLFCLVMVASTVFAEPPRLMNFQGRLKNSSGTDINTTVDMVFKLYTASSGGTAIWTETRSGANTVTVSNGIFSVLLGEITSLDVNFDQQYWLGITVASDSEMSPRLKLASAPYAFDSNSLNTFPSSAYVRGSDGNLYYYKQSDANSLFAKISDVNGNFVKSADGNLYYYKQSDANAVFVKQSDGNLYYARVNAANTFSSTNNFSVPLADGNLAAISTAGKVAIAAISAGSFVAGVWNFPATATLNIANALADGNIASAATWNAKLSSGGAITLLNLNSDFNSLYARLGVAPITSFLLTGDFNGLYYRQSDANNTLVKISDSNNAGRLSSNVIANAPWITTAPADTNWQTSFGTLDANLRLRYYLQSDANSVFVKSADGNLYYYKQSDANAIFVKVSDSNNVSRLASTVIANAPWISSVPTCDNNGLCHITGFVSGAQDINTLYYKQSDANAVFVKQSDGNLYYARVNAVNTFSATSNKFSLDVNVGGKLLLGSATAAGLVAGDINADQNLYIVGDLNGQNIRARGFLFGNGSQLTGISFGTCDGNTACHITGFVSGAQDINVLYYKQSDANAIFVKVSDSNNVSRLASTVIANAPWVSADTNWQTSFGTFDANMRASYVKQVDGNAWYVKVLDSNNAGRLSYTVIANAPWISSFTDTNWQTSYAAFDSNMKQAYVRQNDGNVWYVKISDSNNAGRLSYSVIANPPSIPTLPDLNAVYVRQEDGNVWFVKVSDSNNAGRLSYSVIANPPSIPVLPDLNAVYYRQSDANNVLVKWSLLSSCDNNSSCKITGSVASSLDGNLTWVKISDTNNTGRINYAAIAGAPWISSYTDTNWQTSYGTFDANLKAVYVRQNDGNVWFVKVSDSNNAGRLSYVVIANAPWISSFTDSTLDSNADARAAFVARALSWSGTNDFNSLLKAQDLNVYRDLNVAKTANFSVALADGNIASATVWNAKLGTGSAITLLALNSDFNSLYARKGVDAVTSFLLSADFNGLYYRQSDANLVLLKVSDSNNVSRLSYSVIANPPWISSVPTCDNNALCHITGFVSGAQDINALYYKQSDANAIFVKTADGNLFYARIDAVNTFSAASNKFSNDLNVGGKLLVGSAKAAGLVNGDVNIDQNLYVTGDLNAQNIRARGNLYGAFLGTVQSASDINNVYGVLNSTSIVKWVLGSDFNGLYVRQADGNLFYYRQSDANTVLVKWSLLPSCDGNASCNITGKIASSSDGNNTWIKISDSNNVGRLLYQAIADPPSIPAARTDTTLDSNVDANASFARKNNNISGTWDFNVLLKAQDLNVYRDLNVSRTANFSVALADGNISSAATWNAKLGTGSAITLLALNADFNGLYYRQSDANSVLVKWLSLPTCDSNSSCKITGTVGGASDINAQYYRQSDANVVLVKWSLLPTCDSNSSCKVTGTVGSASDINAQYRKISDTNNVGSVKQVTIADANNAGWLSTTAIAGYVAGGTDTNWQTSYVAFDANMKQVYVRQNDGNVWYVKVSDTNKAGRISTSAIAGYVSGDVNGKDIKPNMVLVGSGATGSQMVGGDLNADGNIYTRQKTTTSGGGSHTVDATGSASGAENSGATSYITNDTLQYHVYTMSQVFCSGTTIYSSTGTQTNQVTLTQDAYVVDISWEAVGPADGYRIYRNYNGGGYVDYKDVAPVITNTDNGTGWNSGSESPTPTSCNDPVVTTTWGGHVWADFLHGALLGTVAGATDINTLYSRISDSNNTARLKSSAIRDWNLIASLKQISIADANNVSWLQSKTVRDWNTIASTKQISIADANNAGWLSTTAIAGYSTGGTDTTLDTNKDANASYARKNNNISGTWDFNAKLKAYDLNVYHDLNLYGFLNMNLTAPTSFPNDFNGITLYIFDTGIATHHTYGIRTRIDATSSNVVDVYSYYADLTGATTNSGNDWALYSKEGDVNAGNKLITKGATTAGMVNGDANFGGLMRSSYISTGTAKNANLGAGDVNIGRDLNVNGKTNFVGSVNFLVSLKDGNIASAATWNAKAAAQDCGAGYVLQSVNSSGSGTCVASGGTSGISGTMTVMDSGFNPCDIVWSNGVATSTTCGLS